MYSDVNVTSGTELDSRRVIVTSRLALGLTLAWQQAHQTVALSSLYTAMKDIAVMYRTWWSGIFSWYVLPVIPPVFALPTSTCERPPKLSLFTRHF